MRSKEIDPRISSDPSFKNSSTKNKFAFNGTYGIKNCLSPRDVVRELPQRRGLLDAATPHKPLNKQKLEQRPFVCAIALNKNRMRSVEWLTSSSNADRFNAVPYSIVSPGPFGRALGFSPEGIQSGITIGGGFVLGYQE